MSKPRNRKASHDPREAALTAPLDFMWLDIVWPFGSQTAEEALDMLRRVPGVVTQEFPRLAPSAMGPLAAKVSIARQRTADGRNRRFEREVLYLVRALGADRAKLVAHSTVDVAVCDWARDTARAIRRQRPAVTRILRVYRGALKAMPWLVPEGRAQIESVIRYLEGIPTQRALLQWQRRLGGSRHDRWQLHVWTERCTSLDQYLAPLVLRARDGGRCLSDADRERIGHPRFTENAIARLLHSRYPGIVPKNAGRLIALRIRR